MRESKARRQQVLQKMMTEGVKLIDGRSAIHSARDSRNNRTSLMNKLPITSSQQKQEYTGVFDGIHAAPKP